MKNHNIKKVKHLHKLGYLKKDSSDKAIEEIEKYLCYQLPQFVV